MLTKMKLQVMAVASLFSMFGYSSLLPPVHHHVRISREDIHSSLNLVKEKRAPLDEKVLVHMVLKQQNLDKGHDMLMEISDPSSPKFSQYYSAHELRALFAPHPDNVQTVRSWLDISGIEHGRHLLTPNTHILKFNATVEELERLLVAKYHLYTRRDGTETHISCDEYHLPHDVRAMVDEVIFPQTTSHRPTMLERHATPSRPRLASFLDPLAVEDSDGTGVCSGMTTPACLQWLYNIPAASERSAQPGNKLGILALLSDTFLQSDNDLFFEKWASFIPSGTTPEKVKLGNNFTEVANGEVALDVETAYGLIYPQGIIHYCMESGNRPGSDPLDVFLDAIDEQHCSFPGEFTEPTVLDNIGKAETTEDCGSYTSPNVLSISYGRGEESYTSGYALRQCMEFMKLALRGITIVVATGDSGTEFPMHSCPSGEGRDGETQNGNFVPVDLPSCPYVLAVGGTMLSTRANGTGPEIVASRDVSPLYHPGGGFSNVFMRASYQHDKVEHWHQKYRDQKLDSKYNFAGRAYPDVSAVSMYFPIFFQGQQQNTFGTSASAPVVASMITLVNEKRLAAGKRPVGFVNPTLYGHPEIFNDITEGHIPGCGTDGFAAAPG